jgi:hypothetical protein
MHRVLAKYQSAQNIWAHKQKPPSPKQLGAYPQFPARSRRGAYSCDSLVGPTTDMSVAILAISVVRVTNLADGHAQQACFERAYRQRTRREASNSYRLCASISEVRSHFGSRSHSPMNPGFLGLGRVRACSAEAILATTCQEVAGAHTVYCPKAPKEMPTIMPVQPRSLFTRGRGEFVCLGWESRG